VTGVTRSSANHLSDFQGSKGRRNEVSVDLMGQPFGRESLADNADEVTALEPIRACAS
jgi:hypothetical protein